MARSLAGKALPAPPRPDIEYFVLVDDVEGCDDVVDDDRGVVFDVVDDERRARIAAAAAGPEAVAPGVSLWEEVFMALPAPPRPVEMYCWLLGM